MSRTDKAALLDQADVAIAHQQGRKARLFNRPLGGVLEPKHATTEIAASFRAGWAEVDAQLAA